MKNHNIYIYIYNKVEKKKINFFFYKVEEKKIIKEKLIPLLGFFKKKKKRVCTVFIVFMINLANLNINYQCLSLNLNLLKR